ncbi:MAG: dehydratase [Nitriliruptorales bacterium]|nr:dehydratase [Nitriliruptorales bacterium]
MYFFEDFAPGQVYELGFVQVHEEEMVAFARRFDPQPFHVDRQAAASSSYGRLIASGWYTCSLFMRLYVDGLLRNSSSHGSPGVEDLRWLHPVEPGDVLSGHFEVLKTRPSSRRPNRGTVLFSSEMTNQDDVAVLRMRGRGLFGRRSPARPM